MSHSECKISENNSILSPVDYMSSLIRAITTTPTSEELGIPTATLVRWIKHPDFIHSETPTSASTENSEILKEFKLLKRALAVIKEERDILKKALAIFSVDVPKS